MNPMLKVLNFRRSDPATLPDGEYEGTWGGYVVKVIFNGIEYRGDTNVGIRTPCAPCIVTVLNGEMSVKVK